jgi:hypothetical protein
MQRLLLAAGLFLLAPLVAEFLLGNLPITAFYALLVLAPLYGGGALLIREVVRRTGRGWPSVLVLGLAYGVFEEGISTMSLFNPNYVGLRLLDNGFIPQLGIGGPWTVLVLTLHVVWSISVPIALMEVLAGERRTTPWLGWLGLTVTGLLFVFGAAATTLTSIMSSQFVASAPQLIASAVIALGLVVVALILIPASATVSHVVEGSAPNPWLVGLGSLVLTSTFKGLPIEWAPWLYVGSVAVLAVVAIVSVRYWSARSGWGDMQRLALASGALFTYAWSAFPQPPALPASPEADLAGNIVFAAAAIALVGVAARQVAHREPHRFQGFFRTVRAPFV